MSIAAFGRYRLATTTRSVFKTVDARSLATVKEGDRVPEVIFKTRVRDEKIGGPNPFTWKDVKSSDLFGKKRAVVFALPGGKSQATLLSIFFYVLILLQLSHRLVLPLTCLDMKRDTKKSRH